MSLAIAANLLRVLDEQGVRVRDVPARSGVSKEAIAMASGFAAKRDLVVIESAAGRRQVQGGTPDQQGHGRPRRSTPSCLVSLEARWRARFSGAALDKLRAVLERLAGPDGPRSPLFAGLEPHPDGWRAALRPPATLAHYPMVLHRGGYPDGS